jgi:hypothetical protein
MKEYYYERDPLFYLILHWSVSCILQVEVNKKKVTYNVKLLMGNAFLAEEKLSYIMKLFHFVCEMRLLNWLLANKIPATDFGTKTLKCHLS